MRSFAVAALLAGAAFATPVPQDFDFDAIAALPPVDTPDIPVVDADAQASTVVYNVPSAAASVTAAVLADPTDTSLKVRDATADTAQAFLNVAQYPNDANSAVTPSGWSLVYQNQQASSTNVYGYMGYTVLNSYDPNTCTAKCTAITGCSSVNLYYERDPTVTPTDDNPNPPSKAVIKCVFWGGAVTAASATNSGQYRKQFQVVIAGSNGYASNSVATPAGYNAGVALGTSAINAPVDCNSRDTYMGVKFFTSGPFDVNRCAAACSAQSNYNRQYPASDGTFQTCQFFNTYILYNNSVPVSQTCSLYNESWPAAFATNNGQYRGKDHFTINYSWTYSNTTAKADKPVGCTNPSHP